MTIDTQKLALQALAGHGHVRPRPDGVRMRCGGPAICRVCQQEKAQLEMSQRMEQAFHPLDGQHINQGSADAAAEAYEREYLRDLVDKSLGRAYSLGQTYWMQADSESYSQNRRADETQAKFDAMRTETVAKFESLLDHIDTLQAIADTANEQVAEYARIADLWEAWQARAAIAQQAAPGWTGSTDADAALIMLDRLDVRGDDDDARVDEIAATIRALAQQAGGQSPAAFIRATDLDRLAKPHVSGCAASLEKSPRDGFVPIYLAQQAGEQDPFQPAANWLVASGCGTHAVAGKLMIGHNRAERLVDAARAAAKGDV